MKLNIYSIYDTVAEVFNKPFTDINDATAIRSFVQSVSDQPHKNDYVLYNLGVFTDHDGTILQDRPVKIRSGFDVKSADIVDMPATLQNQAE